MRPAAKYFLIVAGALAAIAGPSTLAAPAAPETSELGTKSAPVKTNTVLLEGKWHSIKMTPRSGLPAIHFYDKLNPVWWLQNSDEPAPPPGYKPDEKRRNIKWAFRNPFHNFGNYVIGIADKPHLRSGRYPDKISNPNGGWNFAVSKRKILRLPFVSYRRQRFEFYFGWRERGNFGIKINVTRRKKNHLESGAAGFTSPSESSILEAPGP